MLARDSRNFHGWGYRRRVVAELESEALTIPIAVQGEREGEGVEVEGTQKAEKAAKKRSMVQDEFDYTTRMIKTNLSNFSAWHNRSKLIPRLLDEQGADEAARRRMLDDGNPSLTSTSPFYSPTNYLSRYLSPLTLPPGRAPPHPARPLHRPVRPIAVVLPHVPDDHLQQ